MQGVGGGGVVVQIDVGDEGRGYRRRAAGFWGGVWGTAVGEMRGGATGGGLQVFRAGLGEV